VSGKYLAEPDRSDPKVSVLKDPPLVSGKEREVGLPEGRTDLVRLLHNDYRMHPLWYDSHMRQAAHLLGKVHHTGH
jgi:hypothetical protein